MNRKPLPADLQRALADAKRSPGWNLRDPSVRRFELDGCTLLVVPFRRWAYRRIEQRAEAWRRERGLTA